MMLLLEVAKLITYVIGKLDFNQPASLYFCSIQGIIGYSLFYSTCITGPIDIAKVEMLKHNIKYIGMLYCVITGCQNAVQALLLDEIIDKFLNEDYYSDPMNFYVIWLSEVLSTLISIASIYGLFTKERKELKTFSRDRRDSDTANYEKMIIADHNSTDRSEDDEPVLITHEGMEFSSPGESGHDSKTDRARL